MAKHTGIEYEVVIRNSDRTVFNRTSFDNEAEAQKFMANAGVGEGYSVRMEIIDWDEIKMEKYASDY